MKAVFMLKNLDDLPPMVSEDGFCLVYEADGQRQGGFAVQERVGDEYRVWIHSSAEVIAALRLDARFVWVKDVQEA